MIGLKGIPSNAVELEGVGLFWPQGGLSSERPPNVSCHASFSVSGMALMKGLGLQRKRSSQRGWVAEAQTLSLTLKRAEKKPRSNC